MIVEIRYCTASPCNRESASGPLATESHHLALADGISIVLVLSVTTHHAPSAGQQRWSPQSPLGRRGRAAIVPELGGWGESAAAQVTARRPSELEIVGRGSAP